MMKNNLSYDQVQQTIMFYKIAVNPEINKEFLKYDWKAGYFFE